MGCLIHAGRFDAAAVDQTEPTVTAPAAFPPSGRKPRRGMATDRALRGALAYHSGCAAEDQVARLYEAQGEAICARRWRGRAGEIDLVARDGDRVIFIEVKQSHSHADAASHLGSRQMQRIWEAASEFLAGEPRGQLTEVRMDVALVDGAGQVQVIRNAWMT